MKNIHYAGEVLMTGDAIADAVVKYAETLAKNGTSASLDVPVIALDGTVTEAIFLLGPASQLVAVSVISEYPEPTDAGLLATVEHERAKFEGRQVQPSDETDTSTFDYDF